MSDDRLRMEKPRVLADVEASPFEHEAIAWRPGRYGAVYLDPVASTVVQLLDGSVTVADLANDVHEVLGVPHAVALGRIRGVVGILEHRQMLEGSPSSEPPLVHQDVFLAEENP